MRGIRRSRIKFPRTELILIVYYFLKYVIILPMNEKVLVFDFDGTIADTHLYLVEISNRLSGEFKYDQIKLEELDFLKEKTAKEVIEYLNVPVLKIPAILSKAKKEFFCDISSINPITGIKEILFQLKSAGVKMGILSSNTLENIKNFLVNHDLDIFDFIYSTSLVWSKNISLKKLIKKHDLPHELVLYIGDEIRDITAAKKLGVKIASVTWGYNSSSSLKIHNPDYLISSPEELLKLCE